MNKKHIVIGVLGILLILAISIVLSGKINFKKEEPAKAETLGIPVEIITVGKEDIREGFSYVGTIKSKNQANLSFKTAGIVQRIFVAEGENFKKGQVLAELDGEDLRARSETVQQKIASAKLNIDYLKDQQDKSQILYEEGAISNQQMLELNYKYDMAVNSHKEALASAREIEVSRKNTKIIAPYQGIVRESLKEEGEMAQPGQIIFSVSEKDDLVVEVAVIEKDLAGIKIGTKALLSITSGQEKETVSGTVTNISSILNPQTRTATIEIPIPSTGKDLLPNMSINVYLVKEEKESVVAVPVNLLVKSQDQSNLDQYFVYVYQEGKAFAREVKIGLNNGEMAEITEGLILGDQVISSNLTEIKNESRVFLYQGGE